MASMSVARMQVTVVTVVTVHRRSRLGVGENMWGFNFPWSGVAPRWRTASLGFGRTPRHRMQAPAGHREGWADLATSAGRCAGGLSSQAMSVMRLTASNGD